MGHNSPSHLLLRLTVRRLPVVMTLSYVRVIITQRPFKWDHVTQLDIIITIALGPHTKSQYREEARETLLPIFCGTFLAEQGPASVLKV